MNFVEPKFLKDEVITSILCGCGKVDLGGNVLLVCGTS